MAKELYMCDFETVVADDTSKQKKTEVWAAGVVQLGTEDVKIWNNIDDCINYLGRREKNVVAYFHNLKFDGEFLLSYLIKEMKFTPAYEKNGDSIKPVPDWKMERNTVKYLINAKGTWYSITYKINGYTVEIRDSLKLLPFSVAQICKDFDTRHKKLSIEYKGDRRAYGTITPQEYKYLKNDLLGPKEALEQALNTGTNKMTIGACCLSEFKKQYKKQWSNLFPDLSNIKIDGLTVWEFCHKTYKGGWCYNVKEKANKVIKHKNNDYKGIKYTGLTLDCNSLFSSQMHSKSGNKYPIGLPTIWTGDIPEEALKDDKYYFVKFRCRFKIKKNMLPTVQIKKNLLYNPTEWLETSDVYNRTTGKYYSKMIMPDGSIQEVKPELYMTCTDFELFKEHYDIYDLEILSGCYFKAVVGLFDKYIDKYMKIKKNSTGAKRMLAKLYLNNLYGKFAMTHDSSTKVIDSIGEDGTLKYKLNEEYERTPGYIPIGSAITSYSRNFTIRAAQKNYYGPNNPGFTYADTDSMHCDLPIEDIKGVKIDPVELCCWKCETLWDKAIFVRQKTYIENVVAENFKEVAEYYNIKCAGLPERSKQLFNLSLLKADTNKRYNNDKLNKFISSLNDDEKDFINQHYTMEDFKTGLVIPGKLLPKRIDGGIILVSCNFTMK